MAIRTAALAKLDIKEVLVYCSKTHFAAVRLAVFLPHSVP